MFDVVWNRQAMKESHLLDDADAVDENGLRTGEKVKTYSEWVDVYANISPAGSEYVRNVFGAFEDYTHYIIAAEPLSIAEQSVIYYEGNYYAVRRAAHDLNTYLYALEAANVQDYPNPPE